MYSVASHLRSEQLVDHAVPGQKRFPFELFRHNDHLFSVDEPPIITSEC